MIDPSDIKAGAQFVVTVARDGVEGGWVRIKTNNAATDGYLAFGYLFPLPASSSTASIDAEIVEAAEQWRASNRRRPPSQPYPDDIGLLERLAHLIDRRRAMLKPLDAIEELLDVIYRNPVTQEVAEAAARVRKDRG